MTELPKGLERDERMVRPHTFFFMFNDLLYHFFFKTDGLSLIATPLSPLFELKPIFCNTQKPLGTKRIVQRVED